MSLKVKDLTYKIKKRVLINRISLNFSTGLLYGILGPNGSGKTTFLKALTGIWAPTEGEVLWNNQNLLQMSRADISRIISLVPQHPPLHFDFTTKEMVRMGRYPFRTSDSENQQLVEEALNKVNAGHLKDRFLSQLSGGERQRVYIARALATQAPVLLLDEPTSSLDLRHQLEIWQLLQALVKKGKIVIAAIHDLMAAKRFCDELVVFNDGKCLAQGTYKSVITPSLLQEIFGVMLEDNPHYQGFELMKIEG